MQTYPVGLYLLLFQNHTLFGEKNNLVARGQCVDEVSYHILVTVRYVAVKSGMGR